MRRCAALPALRQRLCVCVAVRLPVVGLAVGGGGEARGRCGGGEDRSAAGREGRRRRRRWEEEPRRSPGGKHDLSDAGNTPGGTSPAWSDLLTLRLRVALTVSTRLMASAWLRSAQARLPMATSSSNSLSPALQALLRLRTCRDKRSSG